MLLLIAVGPSNLSACLCKYQMSLVGFILRVDGGWDVLIPFGPMVGLMVELSVEFNCSVSAGLSLSNGIVDSFPRTSIVKYLRCRRITLTTFRRKTFYRLSDFDLVKMLEFRFIFFYNR